MNRVATERAAFLGAWFRSRTFLFVNTQIFEYLPGTVTDSNSDVTSNVLLISALRRKMKRFPSVLRTEYALALLLENAAEKAMTVDALLRELNKLKESGNRTADDLNEEVLLSDKDCLYRSVFMSKNLIAAENVTTSLRQKAGVTSFAMHLKTNALSNEVKVHIQKDTLSEELEKLLIL